jgi:hypothetical protein
LSFPGHTEISDEVSANDFTSPTMPELAPGRRRASTLRRNLALCTGEGLVAMPIVFMTQPGNFIVAMLLSQTFHLRETTFGLIVSLPYWCNVLQLFILPFLPRLWSQKTIALTLSWLHLAVWIGLAFALPHIPTDDVARAGRLLFILFGLSALFFSVVGVSWTSWVEWCRTACAADVSAAATASSSRPSFSCSARAGPDQRT